MIIGFAACGGDGLDISTSASNVCSEVAKVACHNLYQCCSEGEIERFLNVSDPRTEPQCQEDVRRQCERSIVRFDAAIDGKRVRFDSSTMNHCLEALVAPSDTCATVDSVLPWTEACMNNAWVGLVADGSQCFAGFECASGDSVCASSQTCTPKPTAGQPCGALGCASGSFCQAGMCRAQLGEGQQCASQIQCLNGLFCDFTAAAPVCAAVHDGGLPCTSNNACKSNQCIPGTCSGSTQSCFTNGNCASRCANNNNTCFQDRDCAPGQCSLTATACTIPTDCIGAGNTCVFPVRCNPGTCVGTPVCSEPQVVADYCQAALNDLPVP
ncbi:MAG TPA: hypothetical protein VN253_07015 [Kofleriaceae bacterium]|nr:hypothetical protein [Kofleriaceae bacterium]